MSKHRQTPVRVGGKNGIVIHDLLCANGPVDPITKEPMINPETGKAYDGKNDDMSDLIHKYLVKLRSPISIGEEKAARFGVLSLLAMNTPIFCYDHPALKKITNTAFTDGISVFVDADFMRKLHKQEEESDGTKYGVLFLLLHELMHKLSMHTVRMRNMDSKIANIAQDLVINGKLLKSFGSTVPPVPLLEEIGQGMNEQSAEKFYKMSEEVVAEMLIIEERKKEQKKQKGEGGKGKNKGKGQGSGGEPGESGEDGDDSETGENDENTEDKKDKDEYSDIHHITPEELIKILEEEGLDGALKSLNYPKSDDVEAIGKMKEKDKLNTIDAVQNALSEASKCGGKYPGQHIAEEAAMMLEGLEKGKLVWRLGVRKHIHGEGQKLYKNDDEAAIPWHLSKETMGVDPWYEGALIPQAPDETVLCLIDTSGSTGRGTMRKEFAQECLSLKKGVSSMGDTARKVIIISADTVLRGEPIVITENNIEQLMKEGVPIFGNGGTSFANCLQEALELPLLKKEKIKSVIYFTDCEDTLPSRQDFEEYLNKGIRIVFVTTPGCWNEEWNQKLTWAEVYCIEDNTEVNMEKTEDELVGNTRKNKM